MQHCPVNPFTVNVLSFIPQYAAYAFAPITVTGISLYNIEKVILSLCCPQPHCYFPMTSHVIVCAALGLTTIWLISGGFVATLTIFSLDSAISQAKAV